MAASNLPRKLLPFLCAVLVTIAGVNLGLSDINSSIESPIQRHLDYLDESKARGEKITLIIIGSSLVISGVDTPMLERLMREKGFEEFSALTVAARSFDLMGNNRILREVLERDVPGLRVVMLDQTFLPEYYPTPKRAGTRPYIWLYSDAATTLAALDGVFRSSASPMEKIRRAGSVLDQFRAGVLAFNFVGALTKRPSDEEAEADRNDPYFVSNLRVTRGHRHHDRVHPSLTPERWEKYFRRMAKAKAEAGVFDTPYSPRVIRYPFEMAKRHDVDLILLFTPSVQLTHHVQLYRELAREYDEEGVRSEVWDYNDLSVPSNLIYMEYDQRGDALHIAAGAEPLTRDIAGRLGEFLGDDPSEIDRP